MLKSIRAETLPNPDSTTVTLSTKEAKRLGFSQIKSLYQIDPLTLMPKKPLLSRFSLCSNHLKELHSLKKIKVKNPIKGNPPWHSTGQGPRQKKAQKPLSFWCHLRWLKKEPPELLIYSETPKISSNRKADT